jgi:hypothetical protein
LILDRLGMLRMAHAAVFAPALAVALGFGLLAAPAQASNAQASNANPAGTR